MATTTSTPRSPFVRPPRRGELATVAALREALHAEARRADEGGGGGEALAADARERLVASTSAALEEERIVVRVAEDPDGATATDGAPALVGIALGRDTVWPPVWRTRRVGEIPEVYVEPGRRGRGLGRALLLAVSDELARRGAEVLRSRVVARDEAVRARFAAAGFEPLLRTFARPVVVDDDDPAFPVRAAVPADVPSLVLLHAAMLEENGRLEPRLAPHPELRANAAAELPRRLADAEHVVLVAEERPGLVVGFAAGRLERGDGVRGPERVGTVTDCFVVPARRRRGLARALATRLARALAARHAEELRLHVVARNADALAFWSSLGYRPVEELLEKPAPRRGPPDAAARTATSSRRP